MKAVVDEVKRRLSIRHVIGARVALKQAGNGELVGLCPFHQEKTPSFTVSEKKGFYHCFGCGASGDALSFVSNTESIGYIDVVKRFASELGIKLPERGKFAQEYDQHERVVAINDFVAKYYEAQLQGVNGSIALSYLQKRGVSSESIKKFRIGYAPSSVSDLKALLINKFDKKDLLASRIFRIDEYDDYKFFFHNRLMFPIMNYRKEVVGFGGRRLSDNQDIPKYINSPETVVFKKSDILYGEHNMDFRLLQTKGAIFSEGYLDIIALYQAGFANAVAPLGTAIKVEHLKKMWQKCDEITLMLDSDTAGKNAVNKLVHAVIPDMKSGWILKIASIKKYKDADELIANEGTVGVDNLLQSAKSLSAYLFASVVSASKNKSPEQKAKEKKELEDLANQFTDPILKREIAYYFNGEFYRAHASKQNKPAEEVRSAAFPLNVTDVEAVIIALICLNPELVDSAHDDLLRLDITDAELESIRTKLLDGVPKDELLNHFYQLDAKYNVEFVKNIENPNYYVIRLFKLITLRNISQEVVNASRDLNVLQTEEVFVRLLSLKKIEEELKIELGIV